jgi:hypothetical protein
MNRKDTSKMTKQERINYRKETIKPFGAALYEKLEPVITYDVKIDLINENGFYDNEDNDPIVRTNLNINNIKPRNDLNALTKLASSKPYVKKVYDNTNTVIISNIPKFVKEDEIVDLVSNICKFKKIFYKHEKTQCVAYITCYKVEDKEKIIKNLNNSVYEYAILDVI